jgi:hypothetical protein
MGTTVNLNETKALLKEVAAIDNRKLSEEVAEAWQSILGFMPLEIAREALHLARKDDRVNWLEPKHIVSWAKEAAFKLDRATGNKPPPEHSFDPQPKCKEHNVLILMCAPCCKKLQEFEELNGQRGLQEFAKSEVYA